MAAGYFQWKGRLGPLDLILGEHTFAPTTISTLVADTMDVKEGDVVIDVGTGTGVLAIIAAKLGASRVLAIDNSPEVEEVGRANAEAHGVADRIEFHQGDLFDPLDEDVAADVIIGDVSGVPDSLAEVSGWFPDGKGGGPRGSELPIRMLREAVRRLRPGGRVFLPTGSLQDETAILDAARALYDKVAARAEKMIPLPSLIADSETLKNLIADGIVHLVPKGSRFLWESRVWRLSGLTSGETS
ncbi:MAG: 50S ribosomal protein L11 methyltransferase [Acidimicrobiia bacterium]